MHICVNGRGDLKIVGAEVGGEADSLFVGYLTLVCQVRFSAHKNSYREILLRFAAYGPPILLVNRADRVEAVTTCNVEANHVDVGILNYLSLRGRRVVFSAQGVPHLEVDLFSEGALDEGRAELRAHSRAVSLFSLEGIREVPSEKGTLS